MITEKREIRSAVEKALAQLRPLLTTPRAIYEQARSADMDIRRSAFKELSEGILVGVSDVLR